MIDGSAAMIACQNNEAPFRLQSFISLDELKEYVEQFYGPQNVFEPFFSSLILINQVLDCGHKAISARTFMWINSKISMPVPSFFPAVKIRFHKNIFLLLV